MKRILTLATFLVAVAATHTANAANVNCERPLTNEESRYLPLSSSYYIAYPQQINAAITDFCKRAQQLHAEGAPELQALTLLQIEARRWVNQNYGSDGMTQGEIKSLADLLAGVGWRGYTDEIPQESKAHNKTASEAKAAAKAATAKSAADNAAAKGAAGVKTAGGKSSFDKSSEANALAQEGVDDLFGDLSTNPSKPSAQSNELSSGKASPKTSSATR